ncbi:MAG: guanylate kinase [Alphaproteobacteria bacterium]
MNDTSDKQMKFRRGLMLVLSSPSGAGKTAISRKILEFEPEISLSVSVTTRAPRPSEVDGRDYFFKSEDEFKEMAKNNAFLEYAKVFDNYYGTPSQAVFEKLNSGKDVLFDIDWQGTQQLAETARDDLVSIFILPPSMEELERRLFSRAQDSEDVVRKRMAKAADEMSHWPEYDYIIVNRDFERCVSKVQAILCAERLKRDRQIGMTAFVNRMRNEAVSY